jgi:hypothetical protein
LEVFGSGGTVHTNVDALTGRVASLIGSAHTVDARQDDILNLNGLKWEAVSRGEIYHFGHAGSSGTRSLIRELSSSTMMITGTTPASYLHVDQNSIVAAAVRDGYHPVAKWSPGSGNTIILWRRGG